MSFLSRQQRVLLVGTSSAPIKLILETGAARVDCVPSLKPGQFPEASVDFALIDGVEGYPELKKISETLYPMMRIGGHIAFHDYGEGLGVKQAVRSFVLRFTDMAGRIDRLQVVKVG